MPEARQYAVFGPLLSGAQTRAFLGCEVVEDKPRQDLPVVVVWLPENVTSDPKRVARLQRETSFVTQLRHPHIIRVYGLECFEEGWARIVAFADGEPLSQLLERAREEFRPVDPRFAARIIVDVCDGVHHAHEEGQSRYAGRPIVHGGVRPDTLIVTFKGRTMVTGYGAAILAPTQHGVPVLEKFVYFAPEQIIGGKATASPATDVYALGAVLYELLAGHPPFTGASDVERAVLTGDPPMIEASGLAGRLGNIAATAMAKRGADRFDSVEVMRDAILQALKDDNVAIPTHDEFAEFVNDLIPPSSAERKGRRELLHSADEPDSVTVLSRPAAAPEGVDAELFEASRPGPVSTMHAPIDPLRTPLPREPDTVIEAPDDDVARAVAAIDPVEDAAPLSPSDLSQPAALPTFDPASSTNWDTAVSDRPISAAASPAVQAVLEAAAQATAPDRATTEAGGIGNHIPPVITDVVRPRDPLSRDVADAEAEEAATEVAVPNAPPEDPGFVVVVSPTNVPASSPVAPALVPPQPTSPVGQPPQPMAPVGYAPPPQAPAGYPPQPQYTQPPQPPFAPPPPQPQPQYAQPTAPPQPQPQYAQPTAPPPGYAPQPQNGHGQPVPPQMHAPGAFVPGAPNIPPAATGPQAGVPGSFVGRSTPQPHAQPNGSVNLPHPPPAPVPRAPIREASSITAFSKREGDGSRSLIFIVIAALIGVLVFIFAFPKEPPKGLAEAPERHRLPKELVQAALENAGKEPAAEAGGPESPEDPESVEAGANPAIGETNPEGTPAPEVPRTGTLAIESDPRVNVYLDNQSLGRTPLSATLPTGRHKLRFTDRRTGINVYRRYRVRPGAEHKDRITFGTSSLVVNAPDGAKILLNGKKVGVAPMEPVKIYEGQYLLRVRLDELSWSERFDAPPGRKIEYNVRFQN